MQGHNQKRISGGGFGFQRKGCIEFGPILLFLQFRFLSSKN